MKKIFFTALIVFCSMLIVSCEAPAIEESNPTATARIIENPIPTIPANTFADDGPGDTVIIILPPKKP